MYCRNCRKWFPNNISICDSCGMPLVEDLDIYGENFFMEMRKPLSTFTKKAITG